MNKPKNLPADERRNVTVEAVVELAGEKDPYEITTAAIASHMNLTQGAIFRHFASKDAIWQSVMDWVANKLLTRVDKAAQGTSSPLDAIEAMFMANIAFVAEHPGAPRLMMAELQRSGDTVPKRMVRSIIKRYSERITALCEKGMETGEIAPDTDCEAVAALYIGMVQGLVIRSLIANDTGQLLNEAPGVFSLFRRGLEARA
ncbi:TetR/AcrR family transcriptional regulator [Mariprofundus erugo]|nr:TetR/AcrR family transcriptional regulator [Mariprofundus erugo]